MGQLGANLAPQRNVHNLPGGIRDALSEELRSTGKAWDDLNPNIQHAEGRETPAHCDAPRGVAR